MPLLKLPVLARRLKLYHMRIYLSVFHKFVGFSLFRDGAAGEYYHFIRAAHRPHTMSYNNYRLVLYESRQRRLYKRLVFHVKACGRLVQQDYRRVLEKRPRDGNTLTLAARQLAAVFADHAVVAVRQFVYKFFAVGEPRRGYYFLVGRVLFPNPDIFLYSVVE